ncbi:hypothetical protein BVY03_04495 [bacterium K02(2017)]|nr:hypothetical protein BVY03_04495 [bacterium K02(2017)]
MFSRFLIIPITLSLLFLSLHCGSSNINLNTPTPNLDEGIAINPASAKFSKASAHNQNNTQRYVVEFSDPSKGIAALQAANAQVVLSVPRRQAVAAIIPANAIKGLQNNPNILSIEPDQIRTPSSESTPYGVPLIQADLLTDQSAIGDVTVCIIDSGYYIGHEDLTTNLNVTASSDIGTGNAFIDGCGHGTHVGGTVSAVGQNNLGIVGVNPSANIGIHVVKVFGDDCSWAYSSTLVKALDECQAATSGKLVVSMSLGGGSKSRFEERAFNQANDAGVLSIAAAGNDGNTRKSYPASYNSVVSVAAIDQNSQLASFSQRNAAVELAAPGVGILSTVPWSAISTVSVLNQTFTGNSIEFSNTTTAGGASATLINGGLCDTTITATNSIILCERGVVSFYDKVINAQNSGALGVLLYNNEPGGFIGTLGDGNSSYIPALSLSQADGQSLLQNNLGDIVTLTNSFSSPGSGYEAWDGTSMATPHVSGAAALIWNNFPSASNQDLRNALQQSALDLGDLGRDNSYGYGLIQTADALTYLQNGPSCTPTQTTETSCSDSIDNDCDGLTDSADSDCETGGGGSCNLAQIGDACTVSSDCCSNKCKGRSGAKTCK